MANTQTVSTTKNTNKTTPEIDWSEIEILLDRHRSELERMRGELLAMAEELLPHIGESMWARLVFKNANDAAGSMDVSACHAGSGRRIAENRIATEGATQ